MRIDVVTIFPDYLKVLDLSLIGKAADRGPLDLHVHDLRDHAHDRHRTVDDTPLGGGAGMVMKPEPWGEALDDLLEVVTRPVGLDGPRMLLDQSVERDGTVLFTARVTLVCVDLSVMRPQRPPAAVAAALGV